MTMRALRDLIVPALFAAIGVAILVGLGLWQLERKAWKEGLIATLDSRLVAPPVALPPPAAWNGLTQEQDEFRRVTFRGAFLNDQETYVFTAGSAFRPDVSGPGYWVFTPVKLADGGVIVVDRGFVPERLKDPASRAAGQVSGPIEIIGALRWPDQPGWVTPHPDIARHLWFARDPAGMAAARGWGRVAPFYVTQEAPVPPGGWPKPGRLTPMLRNEHLQYALTWFGLAAGLLLVFVIWARGRLRRSA